MRSGVWAAVQRHTEATASGDVTEIANGYAEDALLVAPDGEVRGRADIARWFGERIDFFGGMELRPERTEVRGGTAGLDWWGRVKDRPLEGRDEFDVDDGGLIVEQRVVRVAGSDRDPTHIRVESEAPVGRIVLDRDDKRNAVSQPMLATMTAAVAEFATDDTIRAVIIKGEGRDFCAGEDVRGFEFPDDATAEAFLEGPLGFFTALEQVPKPVLIAVHGNALGFGSEVLIAADTVVASPDARFGFAEIDHGAVPSVLVTRGLDVAFRRRALRFALSGERFDTPEAVQARLVHEVDGDPDERVEILAAQQALHSPEALRVIKALLGAEVVDGHSRAKEFMPRVLTEVSPAI
ncbi:MAG: enoyl-CoA hydratase-related protein [Microthrixaceae bacterium]